MSMIRKSGNRFADEIMLDRNKSRTMLLNVIR